MDRSPIMVEWKVLACRKVGYRRQSRATGKAPHGVGAPARPMIGKRTASEGCRREERREKVRAAAAVWMCSCVAAGRNLRPAGAVPRRQLAAASTMTSDDDPVKQEADRRTATQGKCRSFENRPAFAAGLRKNAGIRCVGCPAGTSMVPPCWQGRHARGNRGVSGHGRLGTALQQNYARRHDRLLRRSPVFIPAGRSVQDHSIPRIVMSP